MVLGIVLSAFLRLALGALPVTEALAFKMATLESVPSVPLEKNRQDSYDEKNIDKESISSRASFEPVAVWEDIADSKEKIIGSSLSLPCAKFEGKRF